MQNFNPGDKPTVSRGKLRGQTVGVTAGPDSNGAYVVTAQDGNFYTIPVTNLRAPAEPTITGTDLVNAMNEAGGVREFPAEFVSAMDSAFPGLRGRLTDQVEM